jgi:hypothetical protein
MSSRRGTTHEINEASERVLASDVRYRFVIDAATLARIVHPQTAIRG